MLILVILSRNLLRIRRSARAFARAPGLAFALLLTVALGVGSNSAVFGFLEGLTHPTSSLKVSNSIVSIFRQDRFRGAGPLSPHDYLEIKKNSGPFVWVGAVRVRPSDAKFGDQFDIASVGAVTPTLAGALSLPIDGGVVISHHTWESKFGANPNAVGSLVRIDSVDYKVKGIAPSQLDGLYSDRNVDLWVPLQEETLPSDGQDRQDLWVLGLLRPGVSARQAEAALQSEDANLGELSVTPFTGIAPSIARGLSRVTAFLNFSAAAVFFIACINVGSLLLGRALKRSHETSLRIALGATRAELMWDLFTDSVVISIAGGCAGLLLGIETAHALPAFLFEKDAERLVFAPHLLIIVGTSIACVLVTVICGMMPVLGTVTDRPWMILQQGASSPSKAIHLLRSGLVIGQISACCMLVIATALLVDGLHAALETSAGHRLGDPILLTVQAQPRPDGPEIDIHYFSDVEKAAKSINNVSPLAWTARLPGNPPTWQSFRIQQASFERRSVVLDIEWLTPDSIQLLEQEPVAGRMFGVGNQAHRVAIVDEEAAAEIYGRQSVGMVIDDPAGLPIEVIGVVKRKSKDAIEKHPATIYYGYIDHGDAPKPIRQAQFRVPRAGPLTSIEFDANEVSANYFGALDFPFIAGRKFPEYGVPGQGRVGIINQEAADLYFKGKPLGAGMIDESGIRTEIIGVVKSQAFGIFEQHAEPTIYFPMWQDCPARMTLILKNSKRSSGTILALQRKIETVPRRDPAPIAITTLDKQLARSGLATLRIATLIGCASAATALMLSMLGLLSAQRDAEHERKHDRALRLALGAQRWRIVFLVMKNAGALAFAGSVIGTSLSFALLRFLIADISGIATPPFEVWLIAPLLPVAAVLIASAFPARHASAISPLAIMRDS